MAAVNLKELSKREERLSGGHRLCAGCAAGTIVRQLLMATEHPVVVGCATGCLEVATTIFPYTAWRVPFIHNAFENVAPTIGGVEAAYKALRRRGKIEREIRFVAIGGDGGLYDIGFGSLSGALERGHRVVFVCYNNEAYMNTGIQRSGATPYACHTTTTPAGSVRPGKLNFPKDLTLLAADHDIPYVAQAAPHNFRDLIAKAQKAFEAEGPAFLNILMPCTRGWRFPAEHTMRIAQLAADTCVWPLYEVENGQWRLTYKPKEKKPVEEWLKAQGRFRHLFTEQYKHLIDEIQAYVDRKWEALLKRCGEA